MVMDAWIADLVMPVANMLLAAVRAGGVSHDKQPEQDHPQPPRPFSDCVRPAIESGPGPGQPGVHRAAIRHDRRSQAAWMGPGTDSGYRRRSGYFRPQRLGQAGLPGSGASGMPWRDRCDLWAGDFTACPQFRGPSTAAGILQPHGDPRHRCRWGIRVAPFDFACR